MYFGPFVRSSTYEIGLLKLVVEYLNWQLRNRSWGSMVKRNSDLEEIWNYDNRKLNSKSILFNIYFLIFWIVEYGLMFYDMLQMQLAQTLTTYLKVLLTTICRQSHVCPLQFYSRFLHIWHPLLETPPNLSLHKGWGNAVAIQFAKFLDDQPRSKEVYLNQSSVSG